jgi:hypothetical protein
VSCNKNQAQIEHVPVNYYSYSLFCSTAGAGAAAVAVAAAAVRTLVEEPRRHVMMTAPARAARRGWRRNAVADPLRWLQDESVAIVVVPDDYEVELAGAVRLCRSRFRVVYKDGWCVCGGDARALDWMMPPVTTPSSSARFFPVAAGMGTKLGVGGSFRGKKIFTSLLRHKYLISFLAFTEFISRLVLFSFLLVAVCSCMLGSTLIEVSIYESQVDLARTRFILKV